MLLLFSHSLTAEQRQDAEDSLGVKEFISLPPKLQHLWSNIPSDLDSLETLLEPIYRFVDRYKGIDKYILIQGDFGATFLMVLYAKKIGLIPVYATTQREVTEIVKDDKHIKQSIFKHIKFRRYE
jgi:hypothetical protein